MNIYEGNRVCQECKRFLPERSYAQNKPTCNSCRAALSRHKPKKKVTKDEKFCPECKDIDKAKSKPKVTKDIGSKYDDGKLRYGLIPPEATKALAEVLTYGAKKYAPDNWKLLANPKERYMDALYRHLEAYRSGELVDPESGFNHLSHAITNLAFLTHFVNKELEALKYDEEFDEWTECRNKNFKD